MFKYLIYKFDDIVLLKAMEYKSFSIYCSF